MLIAFSFGFLFQERVSSESFRIIFIDIGLQGVHISNQTRVYSIMPEARNRMNTVFMSFSF
jgi:hypothetical protein